MFCVVGSDFQGAPENLTFTAPRVCIKIEILDDDIHELNENILLDMEPSQGPSSEVGEVNIVTSTAAEVVIVEDDSKYPGVFVGYWISSICLTGILVEIDGSDSVLPETSNSTEVCIVVRSDKECPIGFSFDVELHITDNIASGK